MKTKIFRGSYFEIGFQKGEIYRKNRKNLDHIKIGQEIYKKQLRIYDRFYPEILDEFRGIAEGGHFDKDKTIYFGITSGQEWAKSLPKGCSIFGVKNGHNLFIGRNYDWCPLAKRAVQVFQENNNQAKNFIAVSDMWISPKYSGRDSYEYQAEDFINEDGLYIGLTYAHGGNYNYGITPPWIMKLISEKCSNVDEAINIFKRIPLATPKNFFIADKNANMILIEHIGGKEYRLTRPVDNILIKTNHFIHKDLISYETALNDNPGSDTFLRYYEALMLINKYNRKGKFRFLDIKNIMRDKNIHLFHSEETIWTLALELSHGEYKMYYGDKENTKTKILNIGRDR